jgi:hypothetical protein
MKKLFFQIILSWASVLTLFPYTRCTSRFLDKLIIKAEGD